MIIMMLSYSLIHIQIPTTCNAISQLFQWIVDPSCIPGWLRSVFGLCVARNFHHIKRTGGNGRQHKRVTINGSHVLCWRAILQTNYLAFSPNVNWEGMWVTFWATMGKVHGSGELYHIQFLCLKLCDSFCRVTLKCVTQSDFVLFFH